MRAASKKHERVRIEPVGRLPYGFGYSFGFRDIRIEFDAAGDLDSVSRNTEGRPSFDVAPFGYTHQIEEPERWRNKKPKPSVASLRARRQSRVDQRKGN